MENRIQNYFNSQNSLGANYLREHLSILVLHNGSFKKQKDWLLLYIDFSKLKKLFKKFLIAACSMISERTSRAHENVGHTQFAF